MIMKKVYEKPMMMCDVFTADEYVAACGDKGTHYIFTCNEDAGFVKVVYSAPEIKLENVIAGNYYACGKVHYAPTTDEFIDGYVYKDADGDYRPEWVPVKIWTDGGTNVHCTLNVDKESWETTKS